MRVQQQAGYVLHTRPYRESSLLVDIFCREYGRLSTLAKGARRLRSRVRGLLQPFQPLLIGWAGKGELPVLTGAEAVGGSIDLTGQARLCGFYLNELLTHLLHRHDPHQDLFDQYLLVLERLAQPGDHEWSLRLFEKHLLRELGYALILDREAETGEQIDPYADYQYIPSLGAVRADAADRNGKTFKGSTIIALNREAEASTQARDECKRLMRLMIGHQLGHKVLHSRRLFVGQGATRADQDQSS